MTETLNIIAVNPLPCGQSSQRNEIRIQSWLWGVVWRVVFLAVRVLMLRWLVAVHLVCMFLLLYPIDCHSRMPIRLEKDSLQCLCLGLDNYEWATRLAHLPYLLQVIWSTTRHHSSVRWVVPSVLFVLCHMFLSVDLTTLMLSSWVGMVIKR